ncbi:transcription termination factor MTERF5, chloroplastic isoform X2 [Hevea brasiliensis]|uniref:transcription termination factor MTERF5, chloroplastic isoform X2 n=1 Tax=Hevea brasiliensis TaxID=3981 RepID=UPI0025F879BD|nr:transcription termination factor MTERF5, chloroplastic isoform X2 [Hevea brasiliensis]
MITKSLSIPTNLPFSSLNTRFHPQFQSPLLFPLQSSPFLFHQTTQFLTNPFPKCQNPCNSSPSTTQHQQEDQLKDTHEAIFHFLQDFGISNEDSSSIASNCPKYAKMLIDSVKDLDDWNAWETAGKEFVDLGFKGKVIYMAKDKGDNGKLAFLESLGLSLSSATNVARYITNESLPALINKVKYMKEMLFSGSDDKGLLGKNARRVMKHLSIPIDDDLQQTLSFFEKIEARRGGLDMLGSSDASFRCLVESFPQILLLSLDSHLKPMIELLESIGIPRERMGSIFLLFPPIMLCDIKGIERKVLALKKVVAVDEDFGKIIQKYPWILSTSIQDNYKEIVYLCDMEKVAKVSIDKAIRTWPLVLGCSTSKLKVMLEQFGVLGVKKKLGQVIAKSPQLLLRKPEEFLQVVSFLKDLGFDQETVGKILVRCPEVFATSIEKTLQMKVEFLTSIGVSEDHLPRIIKKYPELLVSDIYKALLPRHIIFRADLVK